MKLLLDTHIWIWSVLQPKYLAARVAEALESPESDLWLSPLSLWELALLVERGRVDLSGNVEEWMRHTLARGIWKEAPVTYEVALETRRIRLSHRDPIDRLLAATARVFDLTLVTADERLIGTRDFRVLPNR